MKVLFVSGFSPIVRDRDASQRFYGDTIGVPLHHDAEYDYVAASDMEGVKHFGLWRLSEAAEACFGTSAWPSKYPEPQATVEFEVDDVDAAAAEMAAAGYELLHEPRTMPWGQRIAHVMSPEGLLIGFSYTPQMRDE